MYHVGCKISQARVFVACARVQLASQRVDSSKRIKTVVWTRMDRRVFHDNENALV